MVLELVRLPKLCARVAAVLVVAGTASACSSMSWMDPSNWGNGDESSAQQMDQQAQTTADNTAAPDLATIPDKPAAPSTPDEQKQVSDSLQADRSHNQYSADALRGGTEAAATPPPAVPPPDQVASIASTADSNRTPPQPAAAPAPQTAPAPADQTAGDSGNTAIDATGGPTTGDTTPAPAPSRAVTATSTMPSGSSSGPAVPAVGPARSAAVAPTSQVAMNEAPAMTAPSSGGMPAVPAMAPGPVPGAQQQVSDADLGFQPSKAPPLDPSVSQFVPAPIIARYRQTSGANPGAAALPSTGAAVPAAGSSKPMGGPEAMSGAVVANFDSLQAGSVAPASVYANTAGLPPNAVVFFPHDTTVLNAEGKAQVHAAMQAFQAAGGQGFIRVVGHSSSRTANMPLQRHLIFNFERSQARANAVARALIAAGVPAAKVLVEAVGDAQPVYYESMPQGEDGNRRAEIFIQS
jgi:outer membrane protein OmpA-like peptidoglycan-associated protein